MSAPAQQPPSRDAARAQREAVWSLVMVAVFAVWTVAFILLSGLVAEWVGAPTENGEVAYIEAWLPWLGVTLLWVLPLLVGLVLAARALRRGAGALASAGLLVNGLAVLLVVGPSLADRVVNL